MGLYVSFNSAYMRLLWRKVFCDGVQVFDVLLYFGLWWVLGAIITLEGAS